MVIDSGGAPGVWMRSGMGRTLGIGAGLAIIAVLLGMTVAMPTNARMGRISAAA